jgi:hypothetical protein
MTLGELLQQFDDETIVARLAPELGDAEWQSRAAATATARGATLGGYASAAVERFTAAASAEDWVTLMSSLNRAADPGANCLRRMIDWSLARDNGGNTNERH